MIFGQPEQFKPFDEPCVGILIIHRDSPLTAHYRFPEETQTVDSCRKCYKHFPGMGITIKCPVKQFDSFGIPPGTNQSRAVLVKFL